MVRLLPVFRVSTILHAIALVSSQSQSDPFIDVPESAMQCQPFFLTFGGAYPPFALAISAPGTGGPASITLTGIPETRIIWTVNLIPGSYLLGIANSLGKSTIYRNFIIHPGLTGTCADSDVVVLAPYTTSSDPAGHRRAGPTIAGVVGGIGGAIALAALAWLFLWRKRKRREGEVSAEDTNVQQGAITNDKRAPEEQNTLGPASPKSDKKPDPETLPYFAPIEAQSFNPYQHFPMAPSQGAQPPPLIETAQNASAAGLATQGESALPQTTQQPFLPNTRPETTHMQTGPHPLPPLPPLPPPTPPVPSPSFPAPFSVAPDTSNRLSTTQLEALQALTSRNVPGDVMAAVINSMLAPGPAGPSHATEGRGATMTPGPPSYDFKGVENQR